MNTPFGNVDIPFNNFGQNNMQGFNVPNFGMAPNFNTPDVPFTGMNQQGFGNNFGNHTFGPHGHNNAKYDPTDPFNRPPFK